MKAVRMTADTLWLHNFLYFTQLPGFGPLQIQATHSFTVSIKLFWAKRYCLCDAPVGSGVTHEANGVHPDAVEMLAFQFQFLVKSFYPLKCC